MGLQVKPGMFIPAKVDNGVLTATVLGKQVSVVIPNLKQSFNEDCAGCLNERILYYGVNNKFKLIVRSDLTYTVYTTSNLIVRCGILEPFGLPYLEEQRCGVVMSDDGNCSGLGLIFTSEEVKDKFYYKVEGDYSEVYEGSFLDNKAFAMTVLLDKSSRLNKPIVRLKPSAVVVYNDYEEPLHLQKIKASGIRLEGV